MENRSEGGHKIMVSAMERTNETKRLTWVLAITAIYFFAELLGGILTNSLALLSDAGHMFSDIAALGLSLFAFQMARRPAIAGLMWAVWVAVVTALLVPSTPLVILFGVIFNEA